MTPFRALACAAGALLAALAADAAAAQTPFLARAADVAAAQTPSPSAKLNAYVDCINRLSERAYDLRSLYFRWAGRNGPTGKERMVLGAYTIYDTAECRQSVEALIGDEPRDATLEAAAQAYVEAVTKLEPLLKEADDYYTQQNYKDDRMAKGKALHPRLVTAWDAFVSADKALRRGTEAINDKRAEERLAQIDQNEGRTARYHIEALMIDARRVLRAEDREKPNLAAITQALNEYESIVKATEQIAAADGGAKIGSSFIDHAKSLLTTAKQLMRRTRDKTPYSTGEKGLIGNGNGSLVEGSPQRLMREYNLLIENYNRGAHI